MSLNDKKIKTLEKPAFFIFQKKYHNRLNLLYIYKSKK